VHDERWYKFFDISCFDWSKFYDGTYNETGIDVLKNEQDMAYLVILWFYWNIGHLVCYLDM